MTENITILFPVILGTIDILKGWELFDVETQGIWLMKCVNTIFPDLVIGKTKNTITNYYQNQINCLKNEI